MAESEIGSGAATMAYRFTGFFTRSSIEAPVVLPEGVAWRKIATPFVGVGVRLPSRKNDKPDPEEARQLLIEIGLGEASDWLYLNYVMWAGRIDDVYGLGISGVRQFGPLDVGDVEKTREAYLILMQEFGVTSADALNFSPFMRGFWDE